MHNYAAAQESDFGYKLPSAGAADHDRFTPQSRHHLISRPESGANLP
jgi:hypothetical protein